MKHPAATSSLPRRADLSRQFRKDWKRIARSGRNSLDQLKKIMGLLANDVLLGPELRDHPLKGPWAHHRECHVGGDFLLIYRLEPSGSIYFVRVGTHAELFS